MGSLDRVLQVRPKAFNGVGVMNPAHPFTDFVFDAPVLVSSLSQMRVGMMLVRADRGAFGDIFLHQRNQGQGLDVGNDLGQDLTPAFHHAHDHRLVVQSVGSRLNVDLAADKGLVHFNVSGKAGIPVHLAHVLTDFMAHAPSGLVGHAKLPLQLFGRDSMPGGGEQVHGIEPLLKGGMGGLKRGARHGVDMVPTPSALIGRNLLYTAELAVLAAFGAIQRFAVSHRHKVVQTARIVWKLFKEVIDRKRMFFHFSPPIPIRYQR